MGIPVNTYFKFSNRFILIDFTRFFAKICLIEKGVVVMKKLPIPISLLIYNSLAARQPLTAKQMKDFNLLQKGYLGEKRFESMLSECPYENIIPLFDCLFEIYGTEVQIDCLLVTTDTIYLLEIKNYSGDYYMKNNQIYHLQSHREIYNPLNQIERSTFLFKKLLDELNIKTKVKSFVIFINREFFCYEVESHLPFIFSSQIMRFLNKVNENSSPFIDGAEKTAQKILSLTKSKSKYEQLPSVENEKIKPGVLCPNCSAQVTRDSKTKLYCENCKKEYERDALLLHAISEFKLLFPEEKITIGSIKIWSENLFSKSVLQRFLKANFNMIGKGRYTYYDFKDNEEHLKILTKKFV